MADMIDGQILEGMYSGIEEKIDEIKQELSLELEINSTQIEASLKDTLESMMNEVRYITQQNSAIYDLSKADINALKDDIDKSTGEAVEKAIANLRAQMDELRGIVGSLSGKTEESAGDGVNQGEQIGAAVDSINARLQFEVESLKNELMGAMAQLAVSVTPAENADGVNTDNFDAAVGALYEKLEAQSGEVGGLKNDLSSLKNELMDAMAQLAVSATPADNANSVNADNFDAAVGALYEKLEAQSNEVGALKGELGSLKDDLMGAVAQLASANASEVNATSTDNEKLNAAVSAIYEKLEAQSGEVGGLKGELGSLKNELMDAMAQLAVSAVPDENAGSVNDEKLNAAMGALYEKLEAQSNEVGGLKGDLDSLKNELMDAMAQLAVSKAPDENAGSTDNEKLNAAVSAIYEKLEAQSGEVGGLKNELGSLKDDLMGAMAQLAMSKTSDENAGSTDNEKLNAAVSAIYEKLEAQSGEVGGLKGDLDSLKDELMGAMAQLAVSVAPDENADNEKLNAAMSALYDKLETQSGEVGGLKSELGSLKDDLVGAIASFATSRVSENAGIANTDNFDAAVGALSEKFDSQTNEVVGLKGEFDTLKDDLMGAMAQLAMAVTSGEESEKEDEKLNAAVGAFNEKLDAQSSEVTGLKEELNSLKDDLMSAMTQLVSATASAENAENAGSEKLDAAVGGFHEKLDAQANEVVGIKDELTVLKDELMNAMAQLAVTVTPDGNADNAVNERLENAVGALYEKLDAQASEVGGIKEEMSSLKEDLLNAMTQLASANASQTKTNAESDSARAAENYGEKLRAEMQTLNENMHSEMESLKDELMNAMAQLAVSVAPEANAGNANNEKLEEAVGSLNRKIDTQAAEVGGLKNELLEAMAQIGMAVSTAPDSKSDFMALRQELVRNQDANEAMELQFDRAIDSLNARMQNEIGRLKSDILNAISGLEIKSSAKTTVRAEDQTAVSRESAEKIASAVDHLNTNLDTQMGALKDELLCAITQVGMAVFNAPDKNDFASFKEQIAKSSNSFTPVSGGSEGKLEEIADNLNERIQAQMSGLKEDMLGAISEIKVSAPASETKAADAQINYDWLAEKLAQKVPVIDYDFMAKRVKELLPEQPAAAVKEDAVQPAETSGAAFGNDEEPFEIDYDLLAEKIAALVPEVDYEELADRVADAIPQANENTTADRAVSAQRRTVSGGDDEPFEIDYDLLAEKIAIIIPEVDYDELADRIANMIPQADENAIADKVASVIPQTDEDEIADKVADAIPLVDYDLIASKVAEKVLGGDYEDIQDRIKTSEREEVDYDVLAEKLASKVPSVDYFTLADRIANVRNDEPEEIDYEMLADKVAERIPETDYDEIADRVAQKVSAIDCDELAQRIAEANKYTESESEDYEEKDDAEESVPAAEIDYDLLAEKVAAKMPAFDYDEISSRMRTVSAFASTKTVIDYDELAEHMKVTASDIPAPEMAVDYDLLAEVLAQKVPTVDYDEISERVKAALESGVESDGVDYDRIAERVSMVLPEVDYDTIAERVASVVGSADEAAIASRVAAAIPQTDENAIAEKVAGSIPSINYDLIADRVARMLENEFDVTVDESGITKIARTVSEEIDYNKVAETVVEMLKKEDLLKKAVPAPEIEKEIKAAEEEAVIASAPQQSYAPAYSYAPQPAYNYAPQPAPQPAYNYAPQPNYNYAAQPAPQQPQPAPQQPQPAPKFPFGSASKKEKPVKRTEAPSAKPAPITDDGEEENEQTTRFKRSFIARIIQSDEETKVYYSKLKNAILQYARTNSQVNWSNDRFSYAGETIAKIGVNGKSLCMYIALNPEEFSTSVYHQKYEGDKKMYEKTPMMVKIKSEVGLKRALRLIPLLMEKLGASAGEKKNVDYAEMYPFKTDDELLEAGLIKMQATAKTGFNF